MLTRRCTGLEFHCAPLPPVSLVDGRGSVGLVDSRGVMTIRHQDEHTRPCRVLEVRSGEADLDCGLGLQTFGIGDVVKVEAGSQGTCG